MSNLSAKLRHLGFEPLVDYHVATDEAGNQFIEAWFSQQPQPSQATIDAVTDAQANAAIEGARLDRNFALSKKDKVLIRWIAQRTGGGSAASIRAELLAIWRNM